MHTAPHVGFGDGCPRIEHDGLLAALVRVHRLPRLDLFTRQQVKDVRAVAWIGGTSTLRVAARVSRTHCAHCQQRITRVSKQPLLYCGEACRKRARDAKSYQRHQERNVAYARERRARLRQEAEPRTCAWCSVPFRPFDDRPSRRQMYCSYRCRTLYASSRRTVWLLPGRDGRGRFRRAP
jgi:hypothetical protein